MTIKNTTYTIKNDNCRYEFDNIKDKTEWLEKTDNINSIINFIHEWCEYNEKINRCSKGLSKDRCNDLLKMLGDRK